MMDAWMQRLAAASKEQAAWSRFHYLLIDSYEESKTELFECTQVDPEKPYYICQSGLPKRIYTYRLGIHGRDYSSLFEFTIYPALTAMLESFGFAGSVHMIVDDEKEACIVLQPKEACSLSAEEFAGQMDARIQSIYEEQLPQGTGRYRNLTVLSRPVTGIGTIRSAYLETERLKDNAFFRMVPGVLTSERLEGLRNQLTYREIISLTRSLCQICVQGEEAKLKHLCEELFLGLLKHSFNMELVRDALSYIKQFLSFRLCIHLPGNSCDLAKLCNPASYILIEECCESILEVLTQLCRSVRQSGIWCDTVAYAAYYLQSNLGRDVSLLDVAGFSDAAPAYLSNLFHQQTGMTIKQYQQKIRMEQASQMLRTTQIKVTEIALRTGFADRRYFTRIFKEAHGMTPQEYRQIHQEKEEREKPDGAQGAEREGAGMNAGTKKAPASDMQRDSARA